MTYNEFINNILETRGRFNIPKDQYYERHHIELRSCGGTNNDENLIDLYAKEHFIAHKLLAEENPDNQKIVYAFWMMAHCGSKNIQERYQCTPEEYEQARISFSEMWSKNHSGQNAPMFGKHHTENACKAISESKKNKHPSDEARKKMSENHADVSGENNPFYNQHHTDETKKKLRESWTDERRLKTSIVHKGKTVSESTREKIRLAHLGKKASEDTRKMQSKSRKKVIFCAELDMFFDSAKDASEKLNIDRSAIGKCCRGVKNFNTAGGYHWRFATTEEIIKYKNNLEI